MPAGPELQLQRNDQQVELTGGFCPDFHAAPRLPTRLSGGGGGMGTGGVEGWKEHGSMFPACRGQPRPPSPTRHVTSPLSARSTRLRSPICLSDTLSLWCSGFRNLVSKRVPFEGMLVFVSAALSVPSRHGSSASKLSAQLMTCLLRIYKARPGQLRESVGGILKAAYSNLRFNHAKLYICRLSCDATEATIHCYSHRICTIPNPRPRVTLISGNFSKASILF